MESDDESGEAAPYADPEPFSISAQGLELTFYASGESRLKALLDTIAAAQASLKLYFYIFSADACGKRVRDALAEAAARGVEVVLIVDDFGSSADSLFLKSLIDAGGTVQRFGARWGGRYLIRNHQKMLIVDDKAAIIGGFNIAQAYFDPPEKDGWNDLAVRVEGAAVKQLTEYYAILARWTDGRKVRVMEARRQMANWQSGSGTVRWLVGRPGNRLSPWAQSVIGDIRRAARLDMMVAYFSPRWGLIKLIGKVAQRGTGEGEGARLLLAAKSDNAATIGAARTSYGKMLRKGVAIYEFEPAKLHAKLIVVDDATYIGSANFDMRSLYINLELMLRIEDAALAARMRDFIAGHLPHSTAVTPELYAQRRTPLHRLQWIVSWFLVTVADYSVTRRLNAGL
ncbi:MAG: phosphatidylserine/phosphatidylglycerophosphate/cardiolipin synthase family protein [Candidatus Andeanibacterium colombiense]|uniref:Phospholipase D n=1 Tax=Candidatus Andeanibacterium colombiense TaxID=3121345 RepID=A0AAJ5X4G5_9SPHN|nr:MAG: phosphatidylserine/phosphatidylglycerophosphate/cardiolipin synthase family protein [Sphingomonadaceae bacterium]